jgi:poly(3-hydroxybutyrate) depolymerase
VPVIVFHGDADATVHRTNGGGVIRQFLERHVVQKWAQNVGVAIVEETGRSGGRAFTRYVHRELPGSVLAEQCTVHGAGHAWPDGDLRGSYTDACVPSASEEMLRFFIGPWIAKRRRATVRTTCQSLRSDVGRRR